MTTSGPQLRKVRRAADVTTVALAARMGISRQTLWALERAAVVDAARADQYRDAVAAVTVASQTPGAAA